MAKSLTLDTVHQSSSLFHRPISLPAISSLISPVLSWLRAHAHGCAPLHMSRAYQRDMRSFRRG